MGAQYAYLELKGVSRPTVSLAIPSILFLFLVFVMQPQFTPSAGLPSISQAMPRADASALPPPAEMSEPGVAPPAFSAAPAAKVQIVPSTSLSSSKLAAFDPSPTRQPNAAPLSTSAAATSAAAAATTTTTTTTFASNKNSATQRKVSKLLDITTSSDIKDLASYVDEVLPGYFYSVDADGITSSPNKDKGDSEAASTSSNTGSPGTRGAAAASGSGFGKAITSATLRSALDHRAIDMHKSFLHEFAAVYQSYQRVAAEVNALQEKCTGLENALSTSTGGSASAAEDFFYQIHMHQVELQLLQHHEKEVDDFRKQHHFGPAEQQVLDEGPVDMNFLNVLERAREVHRRSSELMQSQEYHQGAAAVMESTYTAVARATEKIARHLLATAGTTAAGRGDAGAGATTGGVGAIAADVPEVTGFQLRCVRLLYEESPLLHEKFLDEVARLRRASVLRRYFHLLTTGSANTSSGMYQSGGQPRVDAGGATTGDVAEAGMGARPLEAELNNPTYFFSSLCAWLHQTIVEEQDFLHTFFMNDEAEAQTGRRGSGQGANAEANAPVSVLIDADRVEQDVARQQVLLDSVFGGVCKHIQAALDNVLTRLGRSASALGVARCEGQNGPGDAGEDGVAENRAPAPHKGPRGLTGGLTRLFMAATGRTPLGPFRRKGSDESNAVLQRYATVTTRAQLEAVASSVLHAPLNGVQTCVALVQLFEYYSVTTLTPLLGEEAALTRLIRETAPQQTRDVFQRLLRVLAAHLLDSTVGVIHYTATLRRLASSSALNSTAAGSEGEASSAQQGSASSSMSILRFLTSMTYGEDAEGVSNLSVSGPTNDSRSDFSASVSSATNTKFRQASDKQLQRHSAQDLMRVLVQLVLPPSPEVAAYCSVLRAVLRDTARQADLLHAISVQQQRQNVTGAAEAAASSAATNGSAACGSAGSASHLRTEVAGFVRELLNALWRAAQYVQEDGTLRAHLDDPCRAILQYNVLYQLLEIMEQHSDVLELLCGSADADIATASGETAENGDTRYEFDTLRAEVGAAMNALRRRLLLQWEDAVAWFYFPLSTETVVASVLAANTTAGAEAPGESEAEEHRRIVPKKDVRRALKQVVNVYNTIASKGHLPEPVPLLPALCGNEKVRKEVSAEVTKSVVERVYPAQFRALQKLPPSEELAAVQEEMSPQNLAILVDFGSSSASAPLT
ncbi:hypothetical protein ABB37_03199 [Leptomonas pyrrhocoris]|uniref:Conserved oligomeric Golgi complex subunit 6 n=1 Tax=Leptomonas pyrrhocoris TaxID=157538 RepID=A0A0N0DWN3_LEPPY|nr:hypothetical protein ABB37_03199 [Leptomonas pyrrhocoris]KPA82025.1 hypothetical protein ABB37_03199 [Leptomonas pyrrhocoris]|eukprot:XP_015660464.1 hypothetical protein ABB37_03199 [Leptomonas pyrrhocoris]